MTTGGKRSVFLAQRSYRQRRLRDVLRMLPLVVFVLWLLPLLWAVADGSPTRTAQVAIYIFVVWFAAVVAAALLSARLRPDDDKDSDEKGRA